MGQTFVSSLLSGFYAIADCQNKSGIKMALIYFGCESVWLLDCIIGYKLVPFLLSNNK